MPRCLLQPNGICAVAVSSKAPQQTQQQQLEKKAEPNANVDQQSRGQQQAVTEPTVGATPPQPPAQFESATVADSVKASFCQMPLALTPRGNLPPSRPAHFSVESPPPPRRFASSGGRTQVLPLTSQNRRRVPPLVMLMAEQQQQQLHHRQQMMARGRMPTTPDSRATTTTTTGGMKSCATIPEDPEETNHRPLADELLSIDRTFVSADDEQQQQEEEVHRFVHRLPLHQPPPTFEVQPPTYSPPEPPSKMMAKNFGCESNNLSR
uniref:Uncharacterized protein n=1 Tax=Globodera pallida TaxID=36090 RepID=A0A183CKB8_GLOPA